MGACSTLGDQSRLALTACLYQLALLPPGLPSAVLESVHLALLLSLLPCCELEAPPRPHSQTFYYTSRKQKTYSCEQRYVEHAPTREDIGPRPSTAEGQVGPQAKRVQRPRKRP